VLGKEARKRRGGEKKSLLYFNRISFRRRLPAHVPQPGRGKRRRRERDARKEGEGEKYSPSTLNGLPHGKGRGGGKREE